MLEDAAFWAVLPVYVAQFLLVLARLSFVVILMPGIGEQVIPMNVRLVVLLGFTFAFTQMGLVPPVSVFPLTGFFFLLIGEVTVGLLLGLSLRLAIWVLSIVGTVVATSIGLAQFLGVALDDEAQTVFSNMLSLAGVALLFTADYHVSVFSTFAMAYAEVPVGGYPEIEVSVFIEAIFAGFNFAITLAWPFAVVSLLYNVSLGFINKAMPQLMVAFVGAPFTVGGGLFLFTISVGSLLYVWLDRVVSLAPWL